VPTYNRSRFLEGLITSVFAEAERHGLEDQVEMVVSDNASADGTGEMVARLQCPLPVCASGTTERRQSGPRQNCMNPAHGPRRVLDVLR
jgi:glycosyltransferase involved in cell wall biosynthesis